MPITKPLVFISSTAKDLLEYREATARGAHHGLQKTSEHKYGST